MLLLAAAFAVYGVVDFAMYLAAAPGRAEPPFGDFYAFWSFARFVAEKPPPAIYDAPTLQGFQQSLDPRFHAFYPCPYPPIFLLLLRPLAALPYVWAYVAWIAVTFGAYLAAAAAGRVPRGARLALAAAAPSSVLGLISGQTGFLTAGLLAGGMAIVPASPLLGGAVLGVLAFKPQFILLVPVALLAARQWRALLGLAGMAVLLAGLSGVAFGVETWRAWWAAIPGYLALVQTNSPHLVHFMPTLAAMMRVLGAPDALARPLQIALGLAMVALVWWVFRRGVTAAAAGVLGVATFLATPYAFIYDLPVVTLAVAARWDAGAGARDPSVRFQYCCSGWRCPSLAAATTTHRR
jgi:alpha-1,2-mannosyltransferase